MCVWSHLGLFGSSTSYTTLPFMSGSAVAHLGRIISLKEKRKKNIISRRRKLTRPGLGFLLLPDQVSLREGWFLSVGLVASPGGKNTFLWKTSFPKRDPQPNNVCIILDHWPVSYGRWHGTSGTYSNTTGRQNSFIGFSPWLINWGLNFKQKPMTIFESWIARFKHIQSRHLFC